MTDAKLNLPELKHKNVIPDSLVREIESADPDTARYLLFGHLHRNADVASLREYCRMAISANAFPKMQHLGKKMLCDLLPGVLGLVSVLCVCACVHAHVYCVCVQCEYPFYRSWPDTCADYQPSRSTR